MQIYGNFSVFLHIMKEEQILIRISGEDRVGLTASIMAILAR